MMKTYILTIHFGVNYGSALQTYALSTVLKGLNKNPVVINYVPAKYDMWNEFISDKKNKYPIWILVIAFILKLPQKFIRRRKFEHFLRENLNLTPRCKKSAQIEQYIDTSANFIVGSDQVWNFDYNEDGDKTYLLNFLPEGARKYAYAASVGKTKVSKEEEQILKKYLRDFSCITVREDETCQMIKSFGIDCKHVLDPTLLLDRTRWNELAISYKKKEDYLLIYVMDFLFDDLLSIAKQIADKKNLKIYMISFKTIKDKRINKQFTFLSPKEFLGLIDAASYIVTNSFHGVAFSINYNKQFTAVRKKNYNLRIESLLRCFGLENRFVYPYEKEVDCDSFIDYVEVGNKLDIERKKSSLIFDFLV